MIEQMIDQAGEAQLVPACALKRSSRAA